MNRIKSVAKKMDMPVSEVVRRATENCLERYPVGCEKDKLEVSALNSGKCLLLQTA
ncbi:hypothetical protein QQ054_00630 [Oscillatoria amoena NRMC-F 0135]|nr:hypothetical protein [Oscillatoria laete-virens]MDL5044552.1 hypothetical protein [Oscillatoria amoena NRMC-F 0135]MDL5053018.1 hypothetical protein [Oscillatoria laete-virens NRMC-F 0139]